MLREDSIGSHLQLVLHDLVELKDADEVVLIQTSVSPPWWNEVLKGLTRGVFLGAIAGFIVGVCFLALMIWLFSEERQFSKIVKQQLKKDHRSKDMSRRIPEGDVDEVNEDRLRKDLRMRL